MKVNVSAGKLNYSQRNNELVLTKKGPLGSSVMNAHCMCNVTSMVMAADYNGIAMPTGKYKQEEDNLGYFICNDPEVAERYKKNFPAMYNQWVGGKKDAYWPNEVHDILSFGFNKWVGGSYNKFYDALPLHQFIGNLVNKIAMPVSMTFGKLGHIICVVGFENSMSAAKVNEYVRTGKGSLTADTKILFDDPYGFCTNFAKGTYTTATGNDRTMTLAEFVKYSKVLGQEKIMCHVMTKK